MKKSILTSISLVLFVVAISAQGPSKEIYTNPRFSKIAADHEKLAIVPFKCILSLRPKHREKMSDEEFKNVQIEEGLAVQSALETYFLTKGAKVGYTIGFQTISKTNAILKKNGISVENIDEYTADELAKLLDVDGIISGKIDLNKPMSGGAAFAMQALVGFSGATNSGKITININDKVDADLLWKYEKTLSRGLGSDTNTIVNAMMRKASRKFPYTESK